jgi:hypothetical protein
VKCGGRAALQEIRLPVGSHSKMNCIIDVARRLSSIVFDSRGGVIKNSVLIGAKQCLYPLQTIANIPQLLAPRRSCLLRLAYACCCVRPPASTSRRGRAAPFPVHTCAYVGAASRSASSPFPAPIACTLHAPTARALPLPHACTWANSYKQVAMIGESHQHVQHRNYFVTSR